MSDFLNLDWLTFRATSAVGKVQTYVQLPTFSYEVSWLGASEIITQFNFSASKNFVLKNRPTKPSGVNYLLCIRYRVGDVVYRWKLWSGVGEVLSNVPLYNGEVIKKHFVLEVWNIKDGTVCSNAAAINIITSVVSVPTNFRSLSATALATGVEYNKEAVDISITAKTLPNSAELEFHFKADAGVTYDGSFDVSQWTDQINGFNLVSTVGLGKPSITGSGNSAAIQFKDDDILSAVGLTEILACRHCFLVLKQNGPATDRDIVYLSNDGTSTYKLKQVGGLAYDVRGYAGTNVTAADLTTIVASTTRIVEFWIASGGAVTYNVYAITGGAALETTTASTTNRHYDKIVFGGAGSGGLTAKFDVQAFIGYGILQQSSDVTLVKEYLAEKYGGVEQGFTFPAAPGLGNAWYSND